MLTVLPLHRMIRAAEGQRWLRTQAPAGSQSALLSLTSSSSRATSETVWHTARPFCRPCTLPANALQPISSMIPCHSLTFPHCIKRRCQVGVMVCMQMFLVQSILHLLRQVHQQSLDSTVSIAFSSSSSLQRIWGGWDKQHLYWALHVSRASLQALRKSLGLAAHLAQGSLHMWQGCLRMQTIFILLPGAVMRAGHS